MNVTGKDMIASIKNRNLEHHYTIIDRSVDRIKTEPGIEAVLLSGSFASGIADVFSDIDFKVAFDPSITSPEVITARYLAGADQIGKVVNIFRSTVHPDDRIICYAPFIKFELNIRTADNLSSSWKTGTSKILYQKNDLGNRIVAKAKSLRFSLDDRKPYIQNIAIAFPNLCYSIMGYEIRGERIAARSDLHWIRNVLLEINGYLLLQENEGPRRAENRYPENVLFYYNRSSAADPGGIKEALILLLKWYLDILVPLLDNHGFETRDELAFEVMKVVEQGL